MNDRSFVFLESVSDEDDLALTTKGEQARSEILDAAHRLFLSKGYSATSMRDIAKAADDRAVAGIYNHFATKEAIFETLLRERNPSPEVIAAIEAVEAETGTDFIDRALHAVFPILTHYSSFIELVQIDYREFRGEKIAKVIEGDILPTALQVLMKIQSLPGLRPIEPLVLLRMILSTVVGYVMTQQAMPRFIRDTKSPEQWIDIYCDILKRGITAPPE